MDGKRQQRHDDQRRRATRRDDDPPGRLLPGRGRGRVADAGRGGSRRGPAHALGADRKLEAALGVILFVRSKSGLTLTDAGERFLPSARSLVRGYDTAVDSVAGIRDLEDGTVEFGMFNSGLYVLSGLVPRSARGTRGLRVRVVGANSAQVADAVRSGRLEAGVVALPIDARGLTLSEVLWSCEAAYFHLDPSATAAPATIDALVSRPLCLPEAGYAQTDPTRRQLSERAQQLGRPLVPDIEVETGAAALAIAASGVAGAVASSRSPRHWATRSSSAGSAWTRH